MLCFPTGSRKPRVHFSGIGGTAMVAGARLAVETGWAVRGSDNPLYPPTSEMVAALGVPVATRYAASNLDWGPDVVVVGNALRRGNPEVEAVLEGRYHYVSLPEWLKDVVLRPRHPIVICGTHGKTTTTALTAFVLDRCGLNPGFLIGGQPLDFQYSARLGPEGGPFVIEGDEYDTAFFDKRAKFFHYLPETAVVTSVEFDHGDIYHDIEEIRVTFQRMLRQVAASGWTLLCADNPEAAALREHAFSQVGAYGFSDGADWRGEVGASRDGITRLVVHRQGVRWTELDAPLAGRHNLLNTLAAVAVADLVGIAPERIVEAVRAFRGVRRRMEVFLEGKGVTFVDDFAHHPTAVRETVRAARDRWPGRRLRVLFEPRSNTTVTNRFQDELRDAFGGVDELWLGPLHRGDTIPVADRLDRAAIVEHLQARNVRAGYCDDIEEIVREIEKSAAPGDVVLILSNGAFGGIYERFRDRFTPG